MEQDNNQRLMQWINSWPESDGLGNIKFFVFLMSKGITPPPNILKNIANKFSDYLDAEGKKTLDDAFDLKSKQGVGHPLKHRSKSEIKSHIYVLAWHTMKTENLSVERAIDRVINDYCLFHKKLDPATLSREYCINRNTNFYSELDKLDPIILQEIVANADNFLKNINIS